MGQVITALNVGLDGFVPFKWSDREAHAEELAAYVRARTGPYAQYGPVSATYLTTPAAREAGAAANMEVFVLPHAFEQGSADKSTALGSRTLCAYCSVFRALEPR